MYIPYIKRVQYHPDLSPLRSSSPHNIPNSFTPHPNSLGSHRSESNKSKTLQQAYISTLRSIFISHNPSSIFLNANQLLSPVRRHMLQCSHRKPTRIRSGISPQRLALEGREELILWQLNIDVGNECISGSKMDGLKQAYMWVCLELGWDPWTGNGSRRYSLLAML